MPSKKQEIALLQLQIKNQELLFDKSMMEGEEFARTKLIFQELKKMLANLDELKRSSERKHTENHP